MKSIEEEGSGITAVQMPDSLFENFDSDDLVKQEASTLNLMLKVTEGNFQLRYRHTLDDVFQPNDEIDIRALHVQLQNGIYATLFELLAAASSLIAFADNLRFLTSGSGIDHMKARIFARVKEKSPHLSDEEIIKGSELYIVNNLPNLEKLSGTGIFIFADKENLIRNVFRKVEELKDEDQDKLEAIFDILASKDNQLPFNILYPANGNYYFNYQACIRTSIARDLYDYYVTDKLFNTAGKKKEDRIKIDKIQKGREVKFTRSLKNLFKSITPYSAFRIKYPDKQYNFDFGELQGEFDNLAYFEQENILFVIQVKLSNRTPLSEKRKRVWVEERIEKSALKQLARDLKLLSNEVGLKFVADKLKLKKQIPRKGLRIYPLIVTDNFFIDHCCFDLSGAPEPVICVSYFEIKHLILNRKIHKDQTQWEGLVKNKEGETLIQLIEQNVFWDFIEPLVLKYTVSKSLAVIDEANRLHLKI